MKKRRTLLSFFIVVIINKKSCGSEDRGVGWIRLNQKFT